MTGEQVIEQLSYYTQLITLRPLTPGPFRPKLCLLSSNISSGDPAPCRFSRSCAPVSLAPPSDSASWSWAGQGYPHSHAVISAGRLNIPGAPMPGQEPSVEFVQFSTGLHSPDDPLTLNWRGNGVWGLVLTASACGWRDGAGGRPSDIEVGLSFSPSRLPCTLHLALLLR